MNCYTHARRSGTGSSSARQSTTFGTWGPEVQILSLRPISACFPDLGAGSFPRVADVTLLLLALGKSPALRGTRRLFRLDSPASLTRLRAVAYRRVPQVPPPRSYARREWQMRRAHGANAGDDQKVVATFHRSSVHRIAYSSAALVVQFYAFLNDNIPHVRLPLTASTVFPPRS